MPPSPDPVASRLALLRAALGARARARTVHDGPLVLPLAGAPGWLLRRRDRARLVSVADGTEAARGGGLEGWLMRHQARSSALVLVPDRDAGIALAARWRVDLARVRRSEAGEDVAVAARRHLERTPGDGRPWHAATRRGRSPR